MFFLNALGYVLYYALLIFIYVMWGRLILDFIRAFFPRWRPPSFVIGLSGVIYAITDPGMKVVRRVVKPIQAGAISLDFSWAIVILAASMLLNLTRYLIIL